MIHESLREVPGGIIHTTTARREWWGWFGSMSWLFFMMYGYDMFMLPAFSVLEIGSWDSFIFMVIFALSISVYGWLLGCNPDSLSKIAIYTTPVALVITAVFAFLPKPLCSVLYAVSPVFMAPALTRRVYGVIRTAPPNRRLARYMSGIAVCVAAFTVWMILEPPREIAFLVPAILSVPTFIGVRRSVSLPDESQGTGAFRLSKRIIIMLAAAVAVLCWLNILLSAIHTLVTFEIDESVATVYALLGFLLPLVGFMLYAKVSDKGHERIGFILGMALLLIGIQFAYLPGREAGALLFPLTIAGGLGGSYPEYFILSVPIYFLINAKRPVFVASLGVILNLISSAFLYRAGDWLPEVFRGLDTPLLATASITAVIFIVLVYILFVQCQEKSLAAALYAMLHSGTRVLPQSGETPDTDRQPNLIDNVLDPEEKKVALLLIEGDTQRDISRKLRLPASEVNRMTAAIREKISGVVKFDPVIAAVIKQYKLTRRESEILRCLRRDMTNPAIAAELYLSEATVKVHVHNLLGKLKVETRRHIPAWMASFAAQDGGDGQ